MQRLPLYVSLASVFISSLCFCGSASGQTASPFVAGLAPYERPANAPVISDALPETTRAQWATHGISEPVPPAILAFLKNQGAWYPPFSFAGMTGLYDIRGWHTSPVDTEKR